MKVAYVSATNPLPSADSGGGAEVTAGNWIGELLDRDVEVDVIAHGDPARTIERGDVTVTLISGLKPYEAIEDQFERNDYDATLVQSGWADAALEAANEVGLPSVFSVLGTAYDRETVSEFEATRFVANSRHTQQWITETWGRDSALVYPYIDFDFYTVSEDRSETISMVNPIEAKGGKLFKDVASRLPEREFLAKGGWYSLRNEDFSWDLDRVRILYSTYHDVQPEMSDEEARRQAATDVPLDDAPNVSFITKQRILDLYERTRVLLVPSTWPEAFGRVTLEAMWNGIPVVASHRGGLPEACGGAGLLVDDPDDVDAWVEKICRLDDPDVYETFAERSRARAERFARKQPEQIDRLETVLREAATES